jgi:hypothetical protein
MRQYLRCVTGKCDDAGLIDQLAIAAECGPIIEAYRECEPTDGGVPADRRDDPPPLTLPDAGSSDASAPSSA